MITKKRIETLTISFEQHKNKKERTEYWFARNLQKLLGYADWRNFLAVIEKAKISCKVSKFNPLDHFVEVTNMVVLGSGAEKEIHDFSLTRYACYLIAQNGDSSKEPIAFAQTYFAIQTRKQEILEQELAVQDRLDARKKLTETEKELSRTIYQRGVDNSGFARIRAKGDTALFGGNNTNEMKRKLGITKKRPLADFLPTITIKAKDFATEITNFNAQKEDMHGEMPITNEHIKNNTEVRDTLKRRGIIPENLPPEEDIKKVERRKKSGVKKIAKKDKK